MRTRGPFVFCEFIFLSKILILHLNIICVHLNTTATGNKRDHVQKWLELLSHSSDGAVKAYIHIIICVILHPKC